jgi:hypothetical protein
MHASGPQRGTSYAPATARVRPAAGGSADPAARFVSARQMAHELGEILREGGSWGDADVLVGNAVAEARLAQRQLPPPDK